MNGMKKILVNFSKQGVTTPIGSVNRKLPISDIRQGGRKVISMKSSEKTFGTIFSRFAQYKIFIRYLGMLPLGGALEDHLLLHMMHI